MTAQYSHKHFFRKMPNARLADYFTAKSIKLPVDWLALKESSTDKLLEAFLALDAGV